MWLTLGITSALFLGIYDVLKKWSVRDNDVMTVLLAATAFGALTVSPLFALSLALPSKMAGMGLYAGLPSVSEHGLILAKSALVSVSWVSAYFALKHLPISIVSPIRASAPLWTLLGAVLFFGERLSPRHWVAVTVTLAAYYAFSVVGIKEGIDFRRNRFMPLVLVATLTGAVSALYDKYLLQGAGLEPVTLQVWFSFYLVLVIGGMWAVSRRLDRHPPPPFHWRKSIPLIGVTLIIADFLYFRALSHDEALIAVLSVIRRGSVVVSFAVGATVFRERNKRIKLIPLTGVLVGIGLLAVR